MNDHCAGVNVKGAYLPCLMELASYVEEEKSLGENCLTFLNKMQRVIFRYVFYCKFPHAIRVSYQLPRCNRSVQLCAVLILDCSPTLNACSDYHLVHQFLDDCSRDIDKFKCGHIFAKETEDQEEVCCSIIIINNPAM